VGRPDFRPDIDPQGRKWEKENLSKDNEVRGSTEGSTGKKEGRGTRKLIVLSYRFLKGGKRYLPPIFRGLVGILLIVAGILGFLPILGFWMIPLGLALLATDVPPLRHWLMKRLNSARRRNRKKRQRVDAADDDHR